MPRPLKLRQVTRVPAVTFFKPAGVPMARLAIVTLALEEVEALRLKDTEDLHQEECARQMGISRATFHQVLKSARGKVADALVNGKAIRVEGGVFAFPGGRFRCRLDGNEWDLPPGPLPVIRAVTCPSCNGQDVQPVLSSAGGLRGMRWRAGVRHGWHGMWGRPTADRAWTPGRRTTNPAQRGPAEEDIDSVADT
jgi:uncharacterized protein